MREKVGGLNGAKLAANDILPCAKTAELARQALPESDWPLYGQQGSNKQESDAVLHLLPGYQHHLFDSTTRARFFNSQYTVTDRSDRMGMRLEGPAVPCPSEKMLSEGICLGAVQVPADGQPIVLLNDRQTIGGYPKIGAIIARDTAQLAQLRPGDTVHFEAIDLFQAHTINTLAQLKFNATPLLYLKD
jgi:allophanate hydrolase subunit 2